MMIQRISELKEKYIHLKKYQIQKSALYYFCYGSALFIEEDGDDNLIINDFEKLKTIKYPIIYKNDKAKELNLTSPISNLTLKCKNLTKLTTSFIKKIHIEDSDSIETVDTDCNIFYFNEIKTNPTLNFRSASTEEIILKGTNKNEIFFTKKIAIGNLQIENCKVDFSFFQPNNFSAKNVDSDIFDFSDFFFCNSIEIKNCSLTKFISPQNVSSLIIRNCPKLTSIERLVRFGKMTLKNLNNLKKLEKDLLGHELTIHNCPFQDLIHPKIEIMHIFKCKELKKIKVKENLTISKCYELKEIVANRISRIYDCNYDVVINGNLFSKKLSICKSCNQFQENGRLYRCFSSKEEKPFFERTPLAEECPFKFEHAVEQI